MAADLEHGEAATRKITGFHSGSHGLAVALERKDGPVKILVCGASGFIGGPLAAVLAARGHEVLHGLRRAPEPDDPHAGSVVLMDYTRDHDPEIWRSRLEGVDVVINAVGILRESAALSFGALHVRAPLALFEACGQAGVKRVIQISALGADEGAQSRYHRSKKQADDYLATLPLDWAIVQPSLVYGDEGMSAKLFTTLAALPLIPVPGRGEQLVQPVHLDDLVEAIVRLVEWNGPLRGHLPTVGAAPLRFGDWLRSLRTQMHLPRTLLLPTPGPVMRAAAAVGERLGGLLDRESLGMLERGNTASSEAMSTLLDRPPRPATAFIPPNRAGASANAARLNWALPLLRACVAFLWIFTAIVSLGLYPVEASYALLAQVGITGALAPVALYGAALLDLAFGVGIYALRRHRQWLWRAQIALILAYSLLITWRLPEFWLHPFGPLSKNIPLLAVILLLHEFEERR